LHCTEAEKNKSAQFMIIISKLVNMQTLGGQ